MPRSWLLRLALAALACLPTMSFAAEPLVLSGQGSFFVGGHDVQSDHLTTAAGVAVGFSASGTITVDQVYVHYQIPAESGGNHPPLTLIHGCCLTGKTWETTPDGRVGWDEYFLRKGFAVYVVDQAERGRSAQNPIAINSAKSGAAPAADLPALVSVGHEAAWEIFRFGPKYPEAFPDLQFPLEAQTEFWKQMVPDWAMALGKPNPTVPGLNELARRLGGTILVSHSQSGIYPFQAATADRTGIKGIIAIEPGYCPDQSGDMKPYTGLPILVVFGDYVDQSPRWAPRLAGCRAFVKAANKVGGKAKLLVLPEIGIHGNSHMLMQDRNNLQIADLLIAWTGRNTK
jgi:hypothetical protein